MKNPIVFFGTLILLGIGAFFLAKSQWFKDLITPASKGGGQAPPRPAGNIEGTACTTTDGKAGTIKNGTCVAGNGRPTDNLVERVAPNNNNAPVNNYTATNSDENTNADAQSRVASDASKRGTLISSVVSGRFKIDCYQSIGASSGFGNVSTFICCATDTTTGATACSGARVNKSEAEAEVKNIVTQNASKIGGSNAPNILLLPVSVNCQQYTQTNPYSYQGCSYVFGGFVLNKGRRVCQLKKVSCP